MQGGGSAEHSRSRQPHAVSRSDWERDQIRRILSTVTSEVSGTDVGTSTTLVSQPADERLYFLHSK